MSNTESIKKGTIFYVTITTLIALILFLFHFSIPHFENFSELILFLLISLSILLLNKYIILLPPKGTNLSADSTIYLASIFAFGLESTFSVFLFSSILHSLWERRFALWKHVFNFAMFTIIMVVTYYVFIFSGGEVGTLSLSHLHAYLLALLFYFLVNVLFISIYYFTVSPEKAFSITKSFLLESIGHYFIVLALSLNLAFLFNSNPIFGISLFTIVIVLFSIVLREYHLLFDQVSNNKIYRDQIFNSLPVGSIIYDERTLTYSLNDTAKLFLNMTEEEFRKITKLRRELDDNQEFWNILLQNQKVKNVKAHYKNNENVSLFLISQSDLLDQFDLPVGKITTFTDITEIEQLQKKIYQSEKLALLGEISAKAAHEIRNPLTVIYGFLSLMKQSFTKHEAEKYQIPLMLREFERINSITDEMLYIAKPQKPAIQEGYVEEIVQEVITLYRQSTSKEIQFDVSLVRISLMFDKRQMTQVLYNLIRNSSDAIDSNGIISIYSKVLDNTYQIFVKDNGCGIPMELQSTIFEPFLTSKDSGTGLGLTIVQRIIEIHGGTIELYESNEDGTVFIINLPIMR